MSKARTSCGDLDKHKLLLCWCFDLVEETNKLGKKIIINDAKENIGDSGRVKEEQSLL
jgi:hypothetical protein